MWHEGCDLLAHALVALVTSPPVLLLISESGSPLYSERYSLLNYSLVYKHYAFAYSSAPRASNSWEYL